LQVYAGLTAAALLAPALSATRTAILIFAALSGAAYSQVLPARDSAGRDIDLLGVTGAARN
jgi:hypothetical protein